MAIEDRTISDYPGSLLIGTWWQQAEGYRFQIQEVPYRVRTAGNNRTKVIVRCGTCGAEFSRPATSVIRLKAKCISWSCRGEDEEDVSEAVEGP
ncbi:MAG: hypothetical protein ACRDPS_09670 [Nocardioides sp.]|uniref:hypothetical protein n=1 Tax=Nocardioides sp. TaxID=35761 RepID=UPI003D6A0995